MKLFLTNQSMLVPVFVLQCRRLNANQNLDQYVDQYPTRNPNATTPTHPDLNAWLLIVGLVITYRSSLEHPCKTLLIGNNTLGKPLGRGILGMLYVRHATTALLARFLWFISLVGAQKTEAGVVCVPNTFRPCDM